jgi:hypothetical protein
MTVQHVVSVCTHVYAETCHSLAQTAGFRAEVLPAGGASIASGPEDQQQQETCISVDEGAAKLT